MKSLSLLSLICFGFIAASCGDPGQPETVIVEERIPVKLFDGDLFKGNKILAYLENEEKFLNESNAFFLKGVNSFRNQNDLDSAEHYLRMSILKEPSARAYFELGNVSLDQQDYSVALKAYGIAEQLDYQPLSKIMYNKSCIYSLKGETDLAGQYLEYAIQSGYTNLDHISKDKDLEALRETRFYDQALDKGLRGVSDAENLYWLQFKQNFAKVDFPFSIEPFATDEINHEWESISFDYEKYITEMRDEQFSREVSKEFYYYTQPYENENFVAIVYKLSDVWLGQYAPDMYIMATFTHDGKLIDKQRIGGGEELDGIYYASSLEKDMTINVDIIEPEYEKDPGMNGYVDNKLIDTKKLGEIVFKISDSGKINEVSTTGISES